MKAAIIILPLLCGSAQAADDCPPYVKHDVGGDYYNADDRKSLTVVETFHFTPQVEQLVRGSTGKLGADISYTLEHFPNHPRALTAMSRLALRDKTTRPQGSHYTVECFFDRAIRFRPEDARVRMLFGSYLLAIGQSDPALEQLEEAARLEPSNPTAHYNLGLLYLRRKDYDKARASAQKAYGMGFPLPGLKKQLTAAGEWRD